MSSQPYISSLALYPVGQKLRASALLSESCSGPAVKLGVPLDARAVGTKDEVGHYLGVSKPAEIFVGDAVGCGLIAEEQCHGD